MCVSMVFWFFCGVLFGEFVGVCMKYFDVGVLFVLFVEIFVFFVYVMFLLFCKGVINLVGIEGE